jgi:hypothetical protein
MSEIIGLLTGDAGFTLEVRNGEIYLEPAQN